MSNKRVYKVVYQFFWLYLFSILVFSPFTETNYAQKNEISFEHISIEQGLSQSTVHSIIQDSYGFIWIATEDGLNRFDGYNFVIYRNERDDTTSIANNQIRALLQAKNGIIWAGTGNGLCALTLVYNEKLKKKEEGFYNFVNHPNDSSSISDNDIRCIYQDKFGVIWIGTTNGLNKIIINSDDQKTDSFDKIKFSSSSFNSAFTEATSKAFVSSITEDGNGNLWFGTMGNGTIVYDRKSGKIITYNNIASDLNSIGSNYIIKLFTDTAGRVWVGTYGGGLNRFDYTTKKFIRYLADPNNPNSISENKVYDLVDDKDGNLWIGAFSGGLNKLETKSNRFVHYKNKKQDPLSLNNDFIRCLLIDISGNLWVGTNNGINKTDLKHPKFISFKNNYWDPHAISDSFVLSVFEDRDGKLWAGTNNGLNSYESNTGRFSNHKIPHNNPKSGEGFVYSIAQDEEGFLWLGTFGGGLVKCKTEGKIIKQYLHNEKNKNGILDNRINTIYLQKNGNIIVGTVAGLCVLQKQSDKFIHYLISSQDSILTSGKSIERIYADRNDIYWIGTDNGLFRVDPSDGSCITYLSDETKPESISSNTITTICEDAKGNFWIGTEDGLNKLDRKTSSFNIYTTKNGLPNDYINGLIDDEEGNLWIATNRGISKFNDALPEGKQFRNYDIDDGLQGYEFNINSVFKNHKGEIYFGGTKGLTKFNPKEIKDNPNLPEISIVSFYTMGRPRLSFLQILKTKTITLAADENFFSFEFTAFDFTNPLKNQYAYKLEGFDKDWVKNGNRRFANYTNIDPGEYIFHAKASNNDGLWNEKDAVIKLIINPPFYRTWLAYFTYMILTGILFFLIRKYELKKRRIKNEIVLKEEKEKAKLIEVQLRAEKAELQTKAFESEKELEKQIMRSRIASDLHDEIGSNLSSITLLSSFMSNNIDHNSEITKQLNDINTAARQSAESIRDIIWFINPTSDKLGSLFSRIKDTTNLMLAGINYNVHMGEINADEKINPEFKRNLYLIYKEVLNNIIKHASAKNVEIIFKKENHKLKISVLDDGKGFEVSTAKEGNGMRNIKNRAEQIGGVLEIISAIGKGTKINLETNIT